MKRKTRIQSSTGVLVFRRCHIDFLTQMNIRCLGKPIFEVQIEKLPDLEEKDKIIPSMEDTHLICSIAGNVICANSSV